jgi:hypothetical protein
MALESTQPLTEMSTRNLPGGKSGRGVGLTTLPPSVSLKMSEPQALTTLRASTACTGKTLRKGICGYCSSTNGKRTFLFDATDWFCCRKFYLPRFEQNTFCIQWCFEMWNVSPELTESDCLSWNLHFNNVFIFMSSLLSLSLSDFHFNFLVVVIKFLIFKNKETASNKHCANFYVWFYKIRS